MRDVEQTLFTTFRQDGIYHIQCSGLVPGPGHVYATLVVGSSRAILWDNGWGEDNIGTYVHELTDLPVTAVVSHVHPDHMGGYAQFSDLWLHPMDLDMIPGVFPKEAFDREKLVLGSTKLHLLEDDQVIDLGNRKVRIFRTPGHTQGSVCLYDERTGLVLAGDTVNRRVFLFCAVPPIPLRVYRESLSKIRDLNCSGILAGHHPEPMPSIWADKIIGMIDTFTPDKGRSYDRKEMGDTLMLYTKGKGYGDPEYCGFAYNREELGELIG